MVFYKPESKTSKDPECAGNFILVFPAFITERLISLIFNLLSLRHLVTVA
jgi:hypothetical protein